MSCVEKRHVSHRSGSMLHHRFPNGFTELFMDENDREVSTLTDRAFRSLCIGDDAVYNDEFSYGFSPFNCLKPLVEEPQKKTHHRDTKKQGQHRSQNGANDPQSWKQQQQKSMSHVSSFLKAFGTKQESCEGMLTKNGDTKDSNGESWDKSALRSIQRELSEFSSDYHSNLTGGHFGQRRHSAGDGSATKSGKDAALPSGKLSKVKNGKSTIKLKKLNIKNFFLHSEFSPFQTWQDFNSFAFAQDNIATSIVPTDNLPKWYDSPLYKKLTEAHRIETLHTEDTQPCQEAAVEPPPPPSSPPPPPPKPAPPPPPPKVLPKPSATPTEKRCSSEVAEGSAPWRRNRSRANSIVQVNQNIICAAPHDTISKTVEESLLSFKKVPKSVEVKAIEEVNSLASTPFSICQLMTPLIPSRQPTETSEILQTVLSPSVLDLPYRPDSEAKSTPEPPVKRESYKSLASSILFNLKDNRKRVKSRYSPPKFKTSELADRSTQSPTLDSDKQVQTAAAASSDGTTSGLSTPAMMKDGLQICSPVLDSDNTPTVTVTVSNFDTDKPASDDYLISNLLQSKKNKSPMANKQNYPSLNLYKKLGTGDSDVKQLPVPQTSETLSAINEENLPVQTTGHSPQVPNKERSPNILSDNKGLSPNLLPIKQGVSPNMVPDNKGLLPNLLPVKLGVSPNMAPDNKGLSPNLLPIKQGVLPNMAPDNKGLSPDIAPAMKGLSPNVLPSSAGISPQVQEKEELSQNRSIDNFKKPVKDFIDIKEKDFSAQPASNKEKDISGQPMSTFDVIKVAKEALNSAKNKALIDAEEQREKEVRHVANAKELRRNSGADLVSEGRNILSPNRADEAEAAIVSKSSKPKKEPPPVPKRNFAKSDIQSVIEAQQVAEVSRLTNGNVGNEKQDLSEPKENEPVYKRQGRFKHVFSARQNNYIKSQRYTMTDDDREYEEQEPIETIHEDEQMVSPRHTKDNGHIINDLHILKELERARLGERVSDSAKNRQGVMNIDEEAKAKSDMISRELRNIKRGMLSMRGNTFVKRDLLAKKEQEQNKQDVFSKIDSNVVVNKALINDNYDRAKMALEEVISERLKNKQVKEQDEDGCAEREKYKTSVQDSIGESEEKQNGSRSAMRVKEGLDSLQGNNQLKPVLPQAETELNVPNRLDPKIAPLSMHRGDGELNKPQTHKYRYMKEGQVPVESCYPITNGPEEQNRIDISRQMDDDDRDNLINENRGERRRSLDAPPVPPRSKKGAIRRESISKESGSVKDAGEDDNDNEDHRNNQGEVKEMSAVLGKYREDRRASTDETVAEENKTGSDKNTWREVNNSKLENIPDITSSLNQRTENKPSSLSPRDVRVEVEENKADGQVVPRDRTESFNAEHQEPRKVKRKAPLKPDHVNTLEPSKQEKVVAADISAAKNQAAEEADKTEVTSPVPEAPSESPRKIISPLLQLNGINIDCQSPPDHGSLSSKSSYFSAESALHRNNESDSCVYHSLENLLGDLEDVEGDKDRSDSGIRSKNWERTDIEYYAVSDHESELDIYKGLPVSPDRENKSTLEEGKEHSSKEAHDIGKAPRSTETVNNPTPLSPPNTVQPTLAIPSLFRVKDNTSLSNKVTKTFQPWTPRESLINSERGEKELRELYHLMENPVVSTTDEVISTVTSASTTSSTPDTVFKRDDTSTHHSPVAPLSPSDLLNEVPKNSQSGAFLTVPQEDNRNSDVSPLSEGAESFATSTADTGDEILSPGVLKVPSERAGSAGSGNDSQPGLPKPPVVLPKSEKALLKAMKLTNRRIKKEEAQSKSSHKSSRSSKHKSSKPKSDHSDVKSSEHQSSSHSRDGSSGEKHRSSSEKCHSETDEQRQQSSRSRDGSSGERHRSSSEKRHSERDEQRQQRSSSEKRHSERVEQRQQSSRSRDGSSGEKHRSSSEQHHSERDEQRQQSEKHSKRADQHGNQQPHHEKKTHPGEKQQQERSDLTQRRRSHDRSDNQSERLPWIPTERQGRSSEKHTHDKPEQRHYSSDRVISDVPVYKAHVAERPQYRRSQSIDRHIGDRTERRLSADMSVNDRLDPRSQRIEKSIMDELQQRGRGRDRPAREHVVKRSHSIDSHPPSLSRQSSHTSQLSRQSSMEHTIVTQSFPMTQRKLLQDPDSGQYFFVDMPVQVKTKTFFDPETGNYVQLPVQPPEGAVVPQPSPIEVLNTPMVLYHGFVPVPLTAVAQSSTVQPSQVEQEEFEQRHLERTRRMYNKEGRPYLEPVYGPQDHMLGEFLGTEELDCVS